MERFKIEWTPEANEDYIEILKYVEAVWGLNAALNFMEKTDEIIEVLEIFPKSFPAVHSDRIRRAVITKHTSLYYRLTPDGVELLYFWNNRRNPTDNPFG